MFLFNNYYEFDAAHDSNIYDNNDLNNVFLDNNNDNVFNNFTKNLNIIKYDTKDLIVFITNNSNYKKIDNLPKLGKLNINVVPNLYIDNLPNSLNYLSIQCYFNRQINNLPLNLYKIYLNCEFNNNVNKLPKSLLKLDIDNCNFNKSIDNLPNNLKILKLNSKCNINLDFLPESLQILKIQNYSKKINDLPSSIKEIWILKENSDLINKMYQHKIKYY